MRSEPTRDDLLSALRDGELAYHYQPKVSFGSGRICGVEALIRWHRGNELVPPAAFIPAAEETGAIRQITLGMLPQLIADYQVIRRVAPHVTVAVNISGLDLEKPDLARRVCEAVDKGALRKPQIEITESAIAGTPNCVRHAKLMSAAGALLAMDDFGTGYSSLDTLRSMPFSVVKLDRGMVGDMAECGKSAVVVKSQISLVAQLGMRSVAEGIESADVYKSLVHSGCDEAQGYWIARPGPRSAVVELLAANPAWPASHAGVLRNAHGAHELMVRMAVDWAHVAAYNPRAAQDDPTAHPKPLDRCALTSWCEGNWSALRDETRFTALCKSHERMHTTHATVRAAVLRRAGQATITRALDKLCLANAILSRDLHCLEVAMLEQEVACARDAREPSSLIPPAMRHLPRRGTRTDRSRRRMARTNPDWVQAAS